MSVKDKFANILQKLMTFAVQQRIMVWIFPVMLIIPNVLLSFTEAAPALAKLTNMILPFGIFLWLMSLSRNVCRTVLFCLPFTAYAGFQIVLLYLYGESIIATDMMLSVFTSNPDEARELLSNLLAAIVVIFIVYMPPMIWAAVGLIKGAHLDKRYRIVARSASKALVVAGFVFLGICYMSVPDFTIGKEIFPVNVMRNTVEAVHRTYLTSEYPATSENFHYNAVSSRPVDRKEIYILVIGETSRADNWQLFGYDRPTNPLLGERENIVTFPKTLTESNTTHKTVPLLMSYLDARDYADSIYHTKSIISAFNEAGFSTAFISTQRHNHSFIDFFSNEADTNIFLVDEGKSPNDGQLIESLDNYLDNCGSDKIFVILHSYGSHFNYHDRYPDDFAFFKPDSYTTASTAVRPNLVNAYDNSIRYTDYILDHIISRAESADCVAAVMYVSDHGEDIYDDERQRLLHSSPSPTFFQLHVPLLIWMSDRMIELYPEKHRQALTHAGMDVSSTQSLFHTILDIAGISTGYYDTKRSLTSPDYEKPARFFINDYNEAVPLNVSGLKNADFKMFIKNDISYN